MAITASPLEEIPRSRYKDCTRSSRHVKTGRSWIKPRRFTSKSLRYRKENIPTLCSFDQRCHSLTLIVMMRRILAGVSLIFFGFSFAAAASKPNLVLITLDSVRSDRMGFLGAKGSHTPNLDRLAGESIVFEHAYAQAPGTVVSHATILSGAYPQSTGVSEIGGTLPSSLPYLPDLLKAQSYRTAAFVGSIELDPSNGLAQGFDRGFQSYDAGFRPAIPGDAHPAVSERHGDAVVARAISWLDHNAQGQFFLWVHISDAHTSAS